jgi:hypothetical protein
LSTRERAEPPTIYLDVDGVVTTEAYQRLAGRYALNPRQVGIVASLVRGFGARVVVSSTWRVEDCRPALVEAGLPEGCFHPDWRTAILPSTRDRLTGAMLPADKAGRGAEIAEHVSRNGITRYLVLDDVDVGQAHAGRHVRPDAERGLLPRDAVSAERILAGMGIPDHAAASVRRPSAAA